MSASTGSGYSDEDEGSLMTDINITPLVDVVLVLLIVFLMTVPAVVSSTALKVNLPESGSGAKPLTASPWELVLRPNDSDGFELFLSDELVDRDQIQQMLEQSEVPRDMQQVRLSADRGVPYGEIIKVLDMLAELKLEKVSLRTKPK